MACLASRPAVQVVLLLLPDDAGNSTSEPVRLAEFVVVDVGQDLKTQRASAT
jgi:hypothetical protein